ncbi:CPBP family intramembrane glutamic endopeptidase [Paenibacillus sp. LHD-38]|uniref:CPBP family intramembrane glutamic endopeptidase n=1 Tax=Paenibacillus sp. LHD-38 TaxID=3072143 RepID=UPI00280C666C|nr:CPBP family intramembrane glutamic endopeptidase [Paenibacillus sp. LHD-38]MDQ8734936.1 CPBP family intramembrane glutamic endopeptidase [Paenibacillus sp. LHD-38]
MSMLFAIIGFMIIDLYFNVVPLLYPLNTFLWLTYACFFFVLAHHVAKLTGLGGISDLGIRAHYGWKRNLRIGFLFGAGIWAAMYLLLWAFGDFHVDGIKKAPQAIVFILEVFAGMFLGSLINDLIVRGYVFAHLKGKIRNVYLLFISAFIYALDDVWLVGFSVQNTIFSIVLGLTLGYVLLRSGSIWMNTGIHMGLNVMYCLVYGIPGREAAQGLFLIVPGNDHSFLLENAHIFAAILLLLVIVLAYGRLRINSTNRNEF